MRRDKFNVKDFLDENHAIFSYLRDDNGNRVGIILAVKSAKGIPAIGYAFFEEVTAAENTWITAQTLDDIPRLADLTNLKGQQIKLPKSFLSLNPVLKFNPSKIEKKPLFYLARQRANQNNTTFYIPDRTVDRWQADSVLLSNSKNSAYREFVSGKHFKFEKDPSPSSARMRISAVVLRKQIKKMEYRAYRYFK